MSNTFDLDGEVYRVSVVVINGYKHLHVNNCDVAHYRGKVRAKAYQRARALLAVRQGKKG